MQLTMAQFLLWHCVVSQWKTILNIGYEENVHESQENEMYRGTYFSSVDVQEKHFMEIFFCKVLKDIAYCSMNTLPWVSLR
jgi:hypothetical protein